MSSSGDLRITSSEYNLYPLCDTRQNLTRSQSQDLLKQFVTAAEAEVSTADKGDSMKALPYVREEKKNKVITTMVIRPLDDPT